MADTSGKRAVTYFCIPCFHSRMTHELRCVLGFRPEEFKKPRECKKFEANNGRPEGL